MGKQLVFILFFFLNLLIHNAYAYNLKQVADKEYMSCLLYTSKPYYYKVYLADHDVTTELAPTERAVMFRFTYPETKNAYVIVDAFDKGSYVLSLIHI